jgi:hypothetical protein
MSSVAATKSAPCLSIVVTGGGPEVSGPFLDRLIQQIRWYGLAAEILLVDAAPLLHLPPEARHVECAGASQWVARNAGIRRARGEFVLCTRAQTRFSDAIVAFLASRPLTPGRLYRALCRRGDETRGEFGAGIEFSFGLHRDVAGFRIENDAELLLQPPSGGGHTTPDSAK